MGAGEKVDNLEMPPWEQHAAVINMPRFFYSASTSLHQTAHAGFLITCPFRREKSATKEALELLQKYVQLVHEVTSSVDKSENSKVEAAAEDHSPASASVKELAPHPKRFKCTATEPVGSTEPVEYDGFICNSSTDAATEGGKDPTSGPDLDCKKVEKDLVVEDMPHPHVPPVDVLGAVDLVPVKLAKMGLIFITAPTLLSRSVLLVASRLLDDVQGGITAPPQWCHRILPVQATCALKQSALQTVVGELFKKHLSETTIERDEHLKFAVAFSRRGVDEQTSSVEVETPLDRQQCITTVTEAVVKAFPNVSVDLTTPQVVIVVEVLPLSGSKPCAVCAVSVLPGTIVDAKPRLCIKPLIQSSKKQRPR